jgi:twitching motility protein PilJ
MGIPIASLMIFLFSIQQDSINTAKRELQGIEYVNRITNLLHTIVQNKNLSKLYASGDRSNEHKIVSLHTKIDKEFQRLQNPESPRDRFFNIEEQVASTVSAWNAIKTTWRDNSTISSSDYHAKLESEILKLIRDINSTARLRLDSEINSSILIDFVIDAIPSITTLIGELQDLGVDAILRKVVSHDEEMSINDKITRLDSSIISIDRALLILQDADETLYMKFDSLIADANSVAKNFLVISREAIIKDESLAMKASKYFELGDESLEKYNLIQNIASEMIFNFLKYRVKMATVGRNMQLLTGFLLTAIAILVSAITYRYITSQINSITRVFKRIDQNDFEARSEILSSDELGSIALSLNDMLDRILSLIQSQDERDAIQESIMKLLDEVSDVAKGDLTVEAEVTEDVTGAIADSFNHMIYQLRQIVFNVQDATLQVSSSASYIQATAEQLAEGSSAQAEQIIDSSAALDEMAVSIQQVSENASLSSTVAEQALENAKQGSQAVQNTIQGMHRIRSQVQETAKRIKRLGERSQEISEIVQLIGDIADRTSILALNASIQAARAGEAGRSFAVVAEEVERLAERATNATKQIASLVNTIQSETNEAVIAMEESTHEVVQGSQVADQAGQALNEIESVSSRLAGLIQSISLASTQQARGSDNLSKAMNEISEVTQHTATGTKQTANAISQLTTLADELRNSVSTFKIPNTQNHRNVTLSK